MLSSALMYLSSAWRGFLYRIGLVINLSNFALALCLDPQPANIVDESCTPLS